MLYDLILAGGNIYGSGMWIQENTDIAIKDGRISAIGKVLDKTQAAQVIDVTGKLVSPGFIDTHMHIDKALTMKEDDTTNLIDACNASVATSIKMYQGMSETEIYEDILKRSTEIIEMCIKNGTTCLKTNVQVNDVVGMKAFEAMVTLKEKFKDKIDVLNVTPFHKEEEWRAAAAKGLIDFVGGYPNSGINPETGLTEYMKDYKPTIDKAFELAQEFNLPIDLHVDESDSPDIGAFLYVLQKTLDTRWQGRVCMGHCTGLDAIGMDSNTAATAIAKAAKARVCIETLTSCNMYLMDWKRRGPTRVRELLDAGVCVSVASDNIRDAFRPFGSADLLQEALLTAQVHKFGSNAGLARVFSTITYNAAENAQLLDYGTLAGCKADLVVLDAYDITDAILSQVDKLYVLKAGKVVAKSGVLVD